MCTGPNKTKKVCANAAQIAQGETFIPAPFVFDVELGFSSGCDLTGDSLHDRPRVKAQTFPIIGGFQNKGRGSDQSVL